MRTIKLHIQGNIDITYITLDRIEEKEINKILHLIEDGIANNKPLRYKDTIINLSHVFLIEVK